MNNKQNDIVSNSVKLVSKFVEIVDPIYKSELIKYFVEKMLLVAKDKIDADTIRALIDEVKDLILISNCSLKLDEINTIGNLMIEFINNSKKRREELKNIRLDVDEYED